MALIETHDIVKEYQTGEVVTPVLNGISLTIEEGEFVSIMGPSGSGKSTLMHILGFLDRQSSGDYLFEGVNVRDADDDTLAVIRNRKAGFVFQAYNLLPRASALENVCLPLVYAAVPHREQHERALQALTAVGLSDRAYHHPNQLSGGEQQRVAIARALVNDPKVIFADEPTGNLDTKASLEIMKLLQQLNAEGHTIVVVTHEPDIAQTTKRRLELVDGKITRDEPVSQRII